MASSGRNSESTLLDAQVLSRIRSMELLAKTVVEGFILGLHRSPFRGFSVEFAEYRPYVPGDDIKHIDWRVYARSDRHYLKLYEEETNLGCQILLDASASMECGEGDFSKLLYAKRLAACLAYFMTRQRDAVGLTIFDKEVREMLPARLRNTHLQRIISELERCEAGSETSLAAPLHQAAEVIVRSGIIILISDFLTDLDGLEIALRHLRHVGHDLLAFQIIAPNEHSFPFTGDVEFTDPESKHVQRVSARSARDGYLAEFNKHQNKLRSILASAGVDHTVISTDEPLQLALSAYLYRRARRPA
jgi:uncharacterized protein (DUF58 family)